MAVVAPVVMLLSFAGLQVALVSYARSATSTAAIEACDTASAYGSSAAAGRLAGLDYLRRVNGLQGSYSVTAVPGAGGTVMNCMATGQAYSLLPLMSFTVTRYDSEPIEQFTR